MYIEPSTNIRLLRGVPLDNTYEHTIYFANASAQEAYFIGKTVVNLTNNTYTRIKRGVARVEVLADQVYTCNYMMFRNSAHGAKWFYAFITGVEYINDTTTEITFEIDSIQTYLFETTLKECYVERQHSLVDYAGSNVVPEPNGIGDITCSEMSGTGLMREYVAVIATAYDPDGQAGGTYGGLFSGCKYLAGQINDTSGEQRLLDFLDAAVAANKSDSIVSIFMMPQRFFTSGSAPVVESKRVAIPTKIHGYTPKNKKLLTFPYNYLSIECGNSNATYRYEWFTNRSVTGNNVDFAITSCVSCNPQIAIIPFSYNGSGDNELNWTEKLVMDGFPQVAWSIDAFRAWIAQNAGRTAIAGGTGLIGSVSGALTGNPMMAVGGLSTAVGAVNETVLAANRPPQARGQDSGGIDVATRTKDFYFKRMQLNLDDAIMMDDFFSVYGYAYNEVKVPNTHARPHWTYVKTRNCLVQSNAPVDDVKTICNAFNKGITWWRNGDEVGNYSLDNSPA